VIPFSEQVNRAGRDLGRQPFAVGKTTVFTYLELPTCIHNISRLLRRAGIGPGDVVAIALKREPIIALAYLAIMYHGAVALPLVYGTPLRSLEKLRSCVTPVLIISDRALAADIPCLNISRADLLAGGTRILPPGSPSPDDVCYLNTTSGTTGQPKVAACTARGIYWNTQSTCAYFAMKTGERHLCLFPAHVHPHEFFARPLLTGGTAVLIHDLLPRHLPAILKDFRIHCLMAAPTMQKAMITYSRDRSDFCHTRLFEAGGMPTALALRKAFPEKTGRPITPVWGSTETLGVALAAAGGPFAERLIGRPIPGYQVHIDPAGRGEPTSRGQMYISGPGMMRGYLGCPPLEGAWPTRDQVERREGWYYFKGRLDNMIKRGGLRIYPEELGSVIAAAPSVKQAVVLPYDHPLYGRDIRLFVVKAQNFQGIKKLRQYLREVLEPHEIPSHIQVVDSIPLRSNGKVDHARLQKLFPLPGAEPATKRDAR